MAKLPVISGLKAVKAFSKAGWVANRQTRNHTIMEKIGHSTTLSVPKHKELKRGTLRSLNQNLLLNESTMNISIIYSNTILFCSFFSEYV